VEGGGVNEHNVKKVRLERVWRKINFKQITNFVERTPPPSTKGDIKLFYL